MPSKGGSATSQPESATRSFKPTHSFDLRPTTSSKRRNNVRKTLVRETTGLRTCHLGLNQTTEKWRSKNHLARPELTENLDSSFDVAIHFVQVSRRNPILLMS